MVSEGSDPCNETRGRSQDEDDGNEEGDREQEELERFRDSQLGEREGGSQSVVSRAKYL